MIHCMLPHTRPTITPKSSMHIKKMCLIPVMLNNMKLFPPVVGHHWPSSGIIHVYGDVSHSGCVPPPFPVEEFHQHLNRIDTYTKFTVYRKATHTDQYLNFGSSHHLQPKRSVVETLMTSRANKIISTEEDKKADIKHVRSSLRSNGYHEWIF